MFSLTELRHIKDLVSSSEHKDCGFCQRIETECEARIKKLSWRRGDA